MKHWRNESSLLQLYTFGEISFEREKSSFNLQQAKVAVIAYYPSSMRSISITLVGSSRHDKPTAYKKRKERWERVFSG